VLNLINNSLINGAGTSSSNFTMILSFYRSKSHSFQNPKKTGVPGFLFSATRNPGFRIFPRIGNTTPAFTFINYIREIIAQKLDGNGIHFLYVRKFCRRPTSSEVIATEQSRCSASIERAVLVYIRSV